MKVEIERAAQVLRSKGSFFLATHRQPDGDGLGAMLALAQVLTEMGKRVVVHAPEPAPRQLGFLPGIQRLCTWGPDGCEVAVILDCGALSRVGPVESELAAHPLIINIDHHQQGRGEFGHIKLIDSTSPATGEIVRRLIATLPWPLSPEVALNLYVAVASDTGGFQNDGTDRRAFELAAELVGHGVRPAEVARRLFDEYSLSRLRLLGMALTGLETLAGGRLALLTISRRLLAEAGAELEDTAGLMNQVSAMAGFEVSALLSETEGGVIDVSLRSRNGLNVADVAERLGGGGHPNAAGFRQAASLEAVRGRLLAELAPLLGGDGL